MNIHEYQAKSLLRDYGVPVSDGRVVTRAEDAKRAAGELDGPLWVVKAQIHAGGRGKGKFKEAEAGEKGGVRLAKSVEEADELARQMLGRTLVTHQTGETGSGSPSCTAKLSNPKRTSPTGTACRTAATWPATASSVRPSRAAATVSTSTWNVGRRSEAGVVTSRAPSTGRNAWAT